MTNAQPQSWITLPSAVKEIVTDMLSAKAKNQLAAGRYHLEMAKSRKSESSRRKEADRAQRKMLEATSLMAAHKYLTGEDLASDEPRIVSP